MTSNIENAWFLDFQNVVCHFCLINLINIIIQGVPKTWEFSDELDIVFVMN